jgi:hypothetical protein
MDWCALYTEQFEGSTSAIRVAARKKLDIERNRLYNIDRQYNSTRLLEWTIAMPRGRPKGSTNKKSTQAEALQTALDFVSCAENNLYEYGEYVNLVDNMAVVFSNQLSAGHPIEEELTLIPHLHKLRAAIAKCGKSLAITETEGKQLSIKGDKLRAIVPSWDEMLPAIEPDEPVVQGDFEILKEAFKVCSTLANENADKVHLTSLLLDPNSCTATNGAAIIQYWHGIALPAGIVVSKLFATAVMKQKLKIVGLGATINISGITSSFTVWFENGAWIKTQCYEDRWPDIGPVINKETTPIPTPAELVEGIEAVSDFTDNGVITFTNGSVNSHDNPSLGAQYEVKDLECEKRFTYRLISQVAPWMNKVDLTTYPDRIFFYGGEASNPIRGCVMAMGLV